MSSNLEPTYLRYVYDGLISGTVHPENASELPDGLVGVYEEAFDSQTSVVVRQKLLERFAIWALVKKEVSASFIAEVLGETEDNILEFVSTYSSWFNSPESGKYQLYHERLKVYLLQKLSEAEVFALHTKLIVRLQTALTEKQADEFELYALEYLAAHLYIEAMISGDGKQLISLTYNQNHWERQLKVSKAYSWTKNGLKSLMIWASKHNQEEVIECGLQMVDLYHQELNSAPQIVALVAEGDFDSALKRIEQFGENDKEGLQRKFILYMLCLMEITLLDSRSKSFQKEGIEKLLKHLDENIPIDHSILNWNDFFPSYVMFRMACEWAELGLDYLLVYRRTTKWDNDWIIEQAPFSNLDFEILFACAEAINNDYYKCKTLTDIGAEFARQGHLKKARFCIAKALKCAQEISGEDNGIYKSDVLKIISIELANQGYFKEAITCNQEIIDIADKDSSLACICAEMSKHGKFEEALDYITRIKTNEEKSNAFRTIGLEFALRGRLKEADYTMREALICARLISNKRNTSYALMKICSVLVEQGQELKAANVKKEALLLVREISELNERSNALTHISEELFKQGNGSEAETLLQEALACALAMKDGRFKSRAIGVISFELAKQGKLEEALANVNNIKNDNLKSLELTKISAEIVKQGYSNNILFCANAIIDRSAKIRVIKTICTNLAKIGEIEKTAFIFKDYMDRGKEFGYDNKLSLTLKNSYSQLLKKGQYEKAILCARWVKDKTEKSNALKFISAELAIQGNLEVAATVMLEAIACALIIDDELDKISAITSISSELTNQCDLALAANLMQEAISCANRIYGETDKCSALGTISSAFAKQGHIEEASSFMQDSIAKARRIKNVSERCSALKCISAELVQQGKFEVSYTILQEAIICSIDICDNVDKSIVLWEISSELSKQGHFDEALRCTHAINDDFWKSFTLESISSELAKQGLFDRALKCIQGIRKDFIMSTALKIMCKELARHCQIEKAISCIQGINDVRVRSSALLDISIEFAKQNLLKEAESAINGALICARSISDDSSKCIELTAISSELAKQGYLDKAEQTAIEISQSSTRNNTWKKFVGNTSNKDSAKMEFERSYLLRSEEAQKYYRKGWCENISLVATDTFVISKVLPVLVPDIESIELLLQKYALRMLTKENSSKEKINRLNRTLNIQWAIDISNQIK